MLNSTKSSTEPSETPLNTSLRIRLWIWLLNQLQINWQGVALHVNCQVIMRDLSLKSRCYTSIELPWSARLVKSVTKKEMKLP